MTTLWVTCVTFKRLQTSTVWEEGIAIGHEPGTCDIKLIIDASGKALKKAPWNYTLYPYRGSFTTITQILEPNAAGIPV